MECFVRVPMRPGRCLWHRIVGARPPRRIALLCVLSEVWSGEYGLEF